MRFLSSCLNLTVLLHSVVVGKSWLESAGEQEGDELVLVEEGVDVVKESK